MKKVYSIITMFFVAFAAVVVFAPQAKARTECIGDFQCPRGQTCVLGACVTSCVKDSDCPVEQECFKGQCIDISCSTSSDCDDGLFCNGAETCFKPSKLLPGTCAAGTAPCVGEICVEADDECIECENDGDCAEGETCEDDVCEDPCPYPSEAADFDEDSNCAFSKDEMKAAKTFFKDEHKAEKDDLKASQAEDKALLKTMKEFAE